MPEQTRGERWWPRFSLSRTLVWLLIIPISLLFGWVESIVFVSACSLYANAASDFAAWRADKDARLDRMEEMIERLEEKLDAALHSSR